MSIKRFLDLPEDAETTYQSVLFENFGVAVYWAQLFEGTLENLLMGMEVTGLLPIDRARYKMPAGAEGITSRCIGQMIAILENDSRVHLPPRFLDVLRKANKSRIDLVHGFLANRADQIVSDAGRIAVTDELLRHYSTVRKAHAMLVPVCEKLIEKAGIKEQVERRIAELRSYGKSSIETDEELPPQAPAPPPP